MEEKHVATTEEIVQFLLIQVARLQKRIKELEKICRISEEN